MLFTVYKSSIFSTKPSTLGNLLKLCRRSYLATANNSWYWWETDVSMKILIKYLCSHRPPLIMKTSPVSSFGVITHLLFQASLFRVTLIVIVLWFPFSAL